MGEEPRKASLPVPHSLLASLDGTVEAVQDELFGVLPAPGTSQDPAPVCRERPPIWSTCELRRACYQGMRHPFLFEAVLIALSPQPDPKSTKKTLSVLTNQFAYLAPRSGRSKKQKGGGTDEFIGEYQTVLEQELFDFVLYEVPWIVF